MAFFAIFNSACSVFGIQSEENPLYEVIKKDDDKEIRQYKPYIVAKTKVQGEYRDAQYKAFRKLAGYIFGDNEGKQEIAMTTPVIQQPQEGETIAMTSPVTQTETDTGWVMTFMMPSQYRMDELPKPKDQSIIFEQVPARMMAAIRYSWFGSKDQNDKKAEELRDWLKNQGDYTPKSKPMYAGYNPPWTLPFFRRNEMLLEVQKK